MGITDRASMLGHYALVAAFGIDPAVLGVSVAPVMVAVMAAGAISAGGLLRSEYAQIWAMGVRMARLLKGAKRGMRMPQIPVSPSELNRKAPRGVIIAAGAAVFSYGVVMCLLAFGMLEGGVTLTSWALHVGVWGCAVGTFGIVWGIRKRRNRVSRRRSKPSNVIRKRLCRAVTNPFLDDQGAFTTSVPNRIKGL